MDINDLYKSLQERKELRTTLIALKNELKDPRSRLTFVRLLGGDFHFLLELLNEEDPKVRKNAALILGELESQELAGSIFRAYQKEKTLFVRSSYLKALRKYDYGTWLGQMKEIMEHLSARADEGDNSKHIREEVSVLQEMLLKYEKPEHHIFTGWDKRADVLLYTGAEHRELTMEQLPDKDQAQSFAVGVKVRTGHLLQVAEIRTFKELLFLFPGARMLSSDPLKSAKELADTGILNWLIENHQRRKAVTPFYFRVDLRGALDMEKKGDFIRGFAREMENRTGRMLINSPSNYELELRLLPSKGEGYLPFVKLYTIKDDRFSYRKNTVASSMAPHIAAQIVRLSADYLEEDAQILDPFCGVGTLLIERDKFMKAGYMYGVDIFEEAVAGARENAKIAGMDINYIKRDFFDFQNSYSFDEIITDMPGYSKNRSKEELDDLYKRFFIKAVQMLKNHGTIILYTGENGLVKKYLRLMPERLILKKEVTVSEKTKHNLYIIQTKNR